MFRSSSKQPLGRVEARQLMSLTLALLSGMLAACAGSSSSNEGMHEQEHPGSGGSGGVAGFVGATGAGGAGATGGVGGTTGGTGGSGGAAATGGAGGTGGIGGTSGTSDDSSRVWAWNGGEIIRLSASEPNGVLVFETGDVGYPEANFTGVNVSPDGTMLAIALHERDRASGSTQGYPAHLLVVPADASAPARVVYTRDPSKSGGFHALKWSADSRWIGMLANIPTGSEPVARDTVYLLDLEAGLFSMVSPPVEPPMGISNSDDEFRGVAFVHDATSQDTYLVFWNPGRSSFTRGVWSTRTSSLVTTRIHETYSYWTTPQVDSLGRVYAVYQDSDPDAPHLINRVPASGGAPETVSGTNPADDAGVLGAIAMLISPEGARLAYAAGSPDSTAQHLFLLELDQQTPVDLSEQLGLDALLTPVLWSPDGRCLLATGLHPADETLELYLIDLVGNSATRLLSLDPLAEPEPEERSWRFTADSSSLYGFANGWFIHVTDLSLPDQDLEAVKLPFSEGEIEGLTSR